jgi:outer membrane protein TolC
MQRIISPASRPRAKAASALLVALIGAIGLAGCASFEGIGSNKQLARASDFSTARSLSDPNPGAPDGQWPGSDWVRQFGDAQLNTLIEEALAANPSLQQARARIGAAAALAESRGAPLLPNVDAQASVIRNQFSSTSIYPSPYGGNWFNEKKAGLNVGYELDLWNKNQAAL